MELEHEDGKIFVVDGMITLFLYGIGAVILYPQ